MISPIDPILPAGDRQPRPAFHPTLTPTRPGQFAALLQEAIMPEPNPLPPAPQETFDTAHAQICRQEVFRYIQSQVELMDGIALSSGIWLDQADDALESIINQAARALRTGRPRY